MATYPNQKTIQLGHLGEIAAKPREESSFLQAVRWDPIKLAMRILNGNAFKLWMFLLSWEGKGSYDFSPANLAKELKMSDEGARNAKKELIDKGYIVDGEFYPISRVHLF